MLPENEPAVRAYLACHTQWFVGPNGRTGLRYEGCRAVLELHAQAMGIEDMSEIMAQVQGIEFATLAADAERRRAEESERAARSQQQAMGGIHGP